HTRSYGDWSSDVCSSDLDAVLFDPVDRDEPQIGKSRADTLDQLGMCARERGVVRRARMPAVRSVPFFERARMLHERHALALHREIGRASCRERVYTLESG